MDKIRKWLTQNQTELTYSRFLSVRHFLAYQPFSPERLFDNQHQDHLVNKSTVTMETTKKDIKDIFFRVSYQQ